MFISLFAQRNEPAVKRRRKGSRSLAASLLVRLRQTTLRCLQRTDASESRYRSAESFIRTLLRCSAA